MLFNLIQTYRGKETVIMTDTAKKCNERKKQLLNSQRKGLKGQPVSYKIEPAGSEDEKYKRKPLGWYL